MADLSSEIRAAAEELAFEFSQSDWEDALIFGFKNDLSLASVLVKASGFGKERKISSEEWGVLIKRAGKLKPALSEGTSLRNRARVWIACHAKYANDALWDLDYAKAKRLFVRGGVQVSAGAKTRREAKLDDSNIPKGILMVSVRQRDKRRDWKTCK